MIELYIFNVEITVKQATLAYCKMAHNQLASLTRLFLVHKPEEEEVEGSVQKTQVDFDGLVWCQAIGAIFPSLEELYIQNAPSDRVSAIEAHLDVLPNLSVNRFY